MIGYPKLARHNRPLIRGVVRKYANAFQINTGSEDRNDLNQVGMNRVAHVLIKNPDASLNYALISARNAIKDESRSMKLRHCFSLDYLVDCGMFDDRTWVRGQSLDCRYMVTSYSTPDVNLQFDILSRSLSDMEVKVLTAEALYQTNQESAEALGITVPAYKSRLQRAQKRARQLAGVCQ